MRIRAWAGHLPALGDPLDSESPGPLMPQERDTPSFQGLKVEVFDVSLVRYVPGERMGRKRELRRHFAWRVKKKEKQLSPRV